jgi:hypothetical protein
VEVDVSYLTKYLKGKGKEFGGGASMPSPTPRNIGRAIATEIDVLGGELSNAQKQWLLGIVEVLIDVLASNDQGTYRKVITRILNDLNTMGILPPTVPIKGESLVITPDGQRLPESYYRSIIRRTIILEQESTAAKVGTAIGKGAATAAKAVGAGVLGAVKGAAGVIAPDASKKAAQASKAVSSALRSMFGPEMPSDIEPGELQKMQSVSKQIGSNFVKMGFAPEGSEKLVSMIMDNITFAMSFMEDPKQMKAFTQQLITLLPKLSALSSAAKEAKKDERAPAAQPAGTEAQQQAGGTEAGTAAPAGTKPATTPGG